MLELTGPIEKAAAESNSTPAGVRIVVVPAEVRTKQLTPADAIVANNLLRRFNVIFDYGHSKLHLKPNRYVAERF